MNNIADKNERLRQIWKEAGYDQSAESAAPIPARPATAEDARLDRLNAFWKQQGYDPQAAACIPVPQSQSSNAPAAPATLREARHRFLDTSAKKAEWSRMLSLNDSISSPPPPPAAA